MRITMLRLLACLIFTLAFNAQPAMSQNDLPKASLRVNEKSDAPPSRKYYIEVETDTSLQTGIYQSLCQDTDDPVKCGKATRIGVLSSKGVEVPSAAPDGDHKLFDNTLLVARDDTAARTRYRIYLPDDMAPFVDFDKKKYSIVLTNYVDSSNQTVVRVIPVELSTLTRTLATDFPGCRRNQFAMSLDYEPGAVTKEYLLKLYHYLDSLKGPDKFKQITIEVEPLSRKGTKPLTVTAVTVAPLKDQKGNDPRLGNFSRMWACFSTDGDIPTEKFDARLTLPSDAPIDLVEPKVVTGLTALSAEPVADVFPAKEKAVGVRPIDKDLNLGFSLVSSVKDEQQTDKTFLRKRNTIGTLDLRLGFLRDVKRISVKPPPFMLSECGPLTEYTEATTAEGSIKINNHTISIAPGIVLGGDVNSLKGGEACLFYRYPDEDGRITDHNVNVAGDPVVKPYVAPYQPPPVTAGTVSIFTPLYIDAKVSTGKITSDTSSLNRVIVGTQEELRYYQNNRQFPTYYRFLFQGKHASDRDFKQREFDGAFEFRPVFAALNHPFDLTNAHSETRILCPTCKPPYKLLPIRYGFEFVPLVGAEIGKTYYRHRPAEAIKPSDTVRRLYFGFDGTINPTPKLSLTASEIFYVRGESKTDRYHNYFLGEFAYNLGRFSSARSNNSVFFSWERGGQPPFDDPDVNVFKVGYRITSTTIFSR